MEEKKEKVNILKRKEIWISGAVGLIIGLGIMYLAGILGFPGLGHETVATFKGGKLTKSSIYKEIEKSNISPYLLQVSQNHILEKEYKLTDEQNKELEEQADSLLQMYQYYYGLSEEEFLKENNFKSKKDFIEYIKPEYRAELCKNDYLKTIISKEEIENYYNENDIYGKISTKHILVRTDSDRTEKEALAMAKEIITKLNNGTNFDDIESEYEGKVYTENVDFDSFDEYKLEESYATASKELEKGTYTKEPVETSYGYHIIYCIDKAEKPALEEIEDDIIEILAQNYDSEYITNKALIELQEKYKLKFNNKNVQEYYKEYLDTYKEEQAENVQN